MGARLSVKISSSLDHQLKTTAKVRAVSKSDVVREILSRHVLDAKLAGERRPLRNRNVGR